MPRASPLPTLIALLGCLLLAAFLPLVSASLSASHDPRNAPAQITQFGEVFSAVPDATHTHDDDSPDDSRWGHPHTHSGVDHSHESLYMLPQHAMLLFDHSRRWRVLQAFRGESALVSALERPPKSVAA